MESRLKKCTPHGICSAAITWGLLGPAAAMWRLGGAVVLAVAAGLSAPATAKGAGTKDAGSSKRTEDKVAGTAQAAASTGVLAVGKRVASSAIDTCADVLPMVMVGLIVSTGLRHLLPPLDQATGSIQSMSPYLWHRVTVFKYISRWRGGEEGMPDLRLCRSGWMVYWPSNPRASNIYNQ